MPVEYQSINQSINLYAILRMTEYP